MEQTELTGQPNPLLNDVSLSDTSAETAINDEELDFDQMNQLYAETLKKFEEGEVVEGTVVRVSESDVLVDVGYKSEGTIPLSEFGNVKSDKPLVNVGDKVEVYLEKKEDNDGLVVLSKEKANKIKVWKEIGKAYDNGEVITGRVVRKIKGGLTVDVGVPAFLPGSQVDLRPVRDLDKLLGTNIRVKVIKLNAKRGNIVLSRRQLLEEERTAKKKEILQELQEGKIMRGVIKNITEYGAFVDLGGMDGLLHVTDMSWGRVRHPSELFIIGDEVDVVVLKFDQENERISLGLKQKSADPWETVVDKYPVNAKVRGKVVSLVDYGAFVELEEGVEGLIHISEMSWTRKIKHPTKVLAIGDIVEVMVLGVNKENKRISLGLKQTEPNPWDLISQKYQIGSKVMGKVRNLTDFGAFMELSEGVDGLVHISDLSWTRRINHPSEVLKKGEDVEAVILNIDPEKEKLSLGIKQLTPDPWGELADKCPEGSYIRRKVTKVTDFGAFVEIEDGIEGLIHVSELGNKKASPQDLVKEGEEVDVKILKIDAEARKISLSTRSFIEDREHANVKNYVDKDEQLGNMVLGEQISLAIATKKSEAEANTKSLTDEKTAVAEESEENNTDEDTAE